jgi:hypothetical protein
MDNPSMMRMSERVLKALVVLFFIWGVLATSLYLNEVMRGQGGEIRVNIGIRYDNRTEWHNSTVLRKGATLLEATKSVASVNYTEYPGMGCFVNSINGVRNEGSKYWIWWYWDRSMGWVLGPVAADKYLLSDGETLLWFYEDTSSYPPPKP